MASKHDEDQARAKAKVDEEKHAAQAKAKAKANEQQAQSQHTAQARRTTSATPAKEDTFIYDGNLNGIPSWADKGWATYDQGPALAVPVGDPFGQPYTTAVARIGDTVIRTNTSRDGHPRHDRFKVIPAQELGLQPGGDQPSNLPAQTTQATLEDLDKTGLLPKEEMNLEQQAQMDVRAVASGTQLPDGNLPGSGAPAAPPSPTRGE